MALVSVVAVGNQVTYIFPDEGDRITFQRWVDARCDPSVPVCHDEHLEEAHRQLDRADLTPEAVCTAIAHVLAYLKERR